MKKVLLTTTAVSVLLLAGCGQPTAETDTSTDTAAEQTQVINDGKPVFGSFGVDLDARNLDVKPGDDWFMYAGGTWYDNYVMPADKTRFGAFAALAEKSQEQVKELIDAIAAPGATLDANAQMVADFYNSYMDTDTLNAAGVAPIQSVLDEISAISDVAGLTTALGRSWLNGYNSPIGGYMWANRTDPNVYQYNFAAGGLGLPDRDYYLEDNERFTKIREAYTAHIAELLTAAGVEDGEGKAAAIIALETKIAEGHWPREKRRNRDLTLNQMDRDAFEAEYAGFDWDAYIAETGYQMPTVNVLQPEPVKAMIALVNSEDLDAWKAYLTYHAISNQSSLLSEELYNIAFAFYGTVLNGQQEPRPRWKRAVSQMSGTTSLGFAIGQEYVKKFFPESSKAQMADLVKNLRTALAERIDDLDWMGDETKVAAHTKLESFLPKIGYPDDWQSFDELDIKAGDLVGNVMRMRAFFHKKDTDREMGPTDRSEWGMTPQQVNAYYNPSYNEIVFPAAILQAPFFDPNADPAVNYGAIGVVIGHEIGHGFDDQGSKVDENGIQRNWWTDADRAAFDAKGDALAEQYSKYEPIEGNFVNGRNSLGENIGDVGGLSMAYHAYKLSLNGEEAPIIDGLTGDQRFFLAYAQIWREKMTEERMVAFLRGATHAPGMARSLAVRNHDAWYEAFDVQPDDKLYLPPEERVKIW